MKNLNRARLEYGDICNAEKPGSLLSNDLIVRATRFSLLVPFLLVLIAAVQPWTDPAWLFLDTLVAIERSGECCSVYYGLFSNLGILLWTASSAICLFSAMVLATQADGKPDHALYALASGLFTGWLALDDFFQVHEKVFPAIGIPQDLTIAVYGVFALLLIFAARRIILQTDWVMLGLAFGFFSVSVIVDYFFHQHSDIRVVIEDGAKFVGIWGWVAFHTSTMLAFLTGARGFSSNVRQAANDKLAHHNA